MLHKILRDCYYCLALLARLLVEEHDDCLASLARLLGFGSGRMRIILCHSKGALRVIDQIILYTLQAVESTVVTLVGSSVAMHGRNASPCFSPLFNLPPLS